MCSTSGVSIASNLPTTTVPIVNDIALITKTVAGEIVIG